MNIFFCLGRVINLFGVKGLIIVKSFTEKPSNISLYGPIYFEGSEGKSFKINVIRIKKDNLLIVHVFGINSRDEALYLRGKSLLLPRTQLPKLINPDEYYINDLKGLLVRDQYNKHVGNVLDIQNYGAGVFLEISSLISGKSFFVQFTSEAITEIVLEKNLLIINNNYLVQ